jgi:8-oxo-dGTP pyrophosphatase MutT (NUDIX family)
MPIKPSYIHSYRKLVCQNSRFDVFFDSIELSGGEMVPDYMIVRPRIQDKTGVAGVLVLPVLAGKVGLMYCYRHQLKKSLWQAPAGFMEPGESPLVCAARELREETGLMSSPSALRSLGTTFPDAGLIEGSVALFLAPCRETKKSVPIRREFGSSKLRFFSREALSDLLMSSTDSMGAATAVAGYRYLGIAQQSFSHEKPRK